MITRLAATILAGLFLAGIVHLSTILLVPRYAEKDVWHQVKAARLAETSFTIFSKDSAQKVDLATDPQFKTAICPFNLTNFPLAIQTGARPKFWSIAIFNMTSQITYSINNRLVASDALEMVLVNEAQLAALQEIGASELEKRIVVPTPHNEGLVVLRAFINSPLHLSEIDTFLETAECFDFEPDLNLAGQQPPDDQENTGEDTASPSN